MKTILLISPYWQEPHRWMVSSVKLAELWQRLGYKVVVVCMGRGDGRHNAQHTMHNETWVEHVSATLVIHRVPDLFLPDPWNYGIAFGFSGTVLRLARELKPDIIIVNKVLFWSSLALLRLRLAGEKVLLTTDALVGITWWPRGTVARACAAIYAWTLGWMILKSATRIVFFHPQPSAVLKKLGIEAKCFVIPTGIDLTGYEIRDTGHRSAASRASHLTSHVSVTYVGRLESVKGVDDFLAATVPLKRMYPELDIQIAGWATPHHPLLSLYEHDVSFLGLRDDVSSLLARTSIFVLPSYSEGLSNALMEAMASGCACIASDVGGNRFLIQNGMCGFLFPAGDREALRSHIERLINDPEKRTNMGLAARQRIEEQCSWEKVGAQYRKLFEEWLVAS